MFANILKEHSLKLGVIHPHSQVETICVLNLTESRGNNFCLQLKTKTFQLNLINCSPTDC